MNPAALLQKGLTAQRSGQLADAAAIYRQMLQRWPQHPDALYLLGLIEQTSGNNAGAVELFERAAKANPKFAPPLLQQGFALNTLGRTEEAAAAFQGAITRKPDMAEAHHQLGVTLRNLHRLPAALASLRQATTLSPKDGVFWLTRGMTCLQERLLDEAVDSFQHAIQINPALPEAHEILGQAFMAQHRPEAARQSIMEALRLRPRFAEAYHDLARICVEEGLLAEAVNHYRAALDIQPEPDTHTNLIFVQNYLPTTQPARHFAEHRLWSERFERLLRPTWRVHHNPPLPDRRLRIAYVSPDFRDHPVASFIEPVLLAHHRDQFEVFCYANVAVADDVTQRLRGQADQWREIQECTPEAVAELIRLDAIDILVDLAGHTTDNSLLAFARKPAPVQVTWIGYPNTTGLEAMDYRLTDYISDPPGQTEAWHREKLIRLPQTFSCYRPAIESPAVGPLPALANGQVTFGCLNNFRKLSEPTIALWARLLAELPTARLLLKSQGLDNPQTARRLLEQFTQAGVSADRIELDGTRRSKEQHLGRYNRVDIGLDPFPYNGTTTTCDALWMGVPVITLEGRTHVARVGISLVTHLGHPEWAAATPDEYVAKCRQLAGNLPALAGVRQQLREQMLHSPLCDASQFIGHLEAAYREMWRRWCETQKE